MAGDGVHVGDAHVDVSADVDARSINTAAAQAGQGFGNHFAKGVNDSISSSKVNMGGVLGGDDGRRAGASWGMKLGESVAEGLIKSAQPILASFPGRVAEIIATPIGPALIAVAAPTMVFAGMSLGAMLGGAILAGLGTIPIAAGIGIAVNNPVVKGAFAELGQFMGDSLGRATISIKKELIGVMPILKEAFEGINFGRVFGNVAPTIEIFANTLRNIAPGLNSLFGKMGELGTIFAPVIGSMIEKFIPAINRFVDKLVSELPGIQSGFIAFGNTIITIIDYFGDLLAISGRMFGNFVSLGANLLDAFSHVADALTLAGAAAGGTGDKMRDMADNMRGSLEIAPQLNQNFQTLANDGLGSMGDAADDAKIGFEGLKRAMDAINQGAITTNEALESFNQTRLRLLDTETRSTSALSLNTEAGLRNRDMLQQGIIASRDLALAQIAEGQSVEIATAKHQERTAQLVNENFTSAEAKAEGYRLIEMYGQVPTDVRTILSALGVEDVEATLARLRVKQVSLWKNISEAEARTNIAKGTYHTGGPIRGPKGKEIDVTALGGEFMMQPSAVDNYGVGFLNALNQSKVPTGTKGTGAGPGPRMARPVGSDWPFKVDASQTKVDPAWVDDGFSKGFSGGPLGSSGGALGGWAGMFAWLASKVPGITLNSGYRPGSMAGGGYDYHHFGRAIDIGPSPGPLMFRAAEEITRAFGGKTLEMIHTPLGGGQIWNGKNYTFQGAELQAGHYDHLHWAMDQGGAMMPGLSMVANKTGRPEAVLNPEHSRRVGAILAGDEGICVHVQIGNEAIKEIVDAKVQRSNHDMANTLRAGGGRH